MWPDRVSNPGPLTCESDALPTVLRVPAPFCKGMSPSSTRRSTPTPLRVDCMAGETVLWQVTQSGGMHLQITSERLSHECLANSNFYSFHRQTGE